MPNLKEKANKPKLILNLTNPPSKSCYGYKNNLNFYLFIYLGTSQKEHLNDRWCFKEMAEQDMTSISKKILFFCMNCSFVSFDSGLPPHLVDWPDAFLL